MPCAGATSIPRFRGRAHREDDRAGLQPAAAIGLAVRLAIYVEPSAWFGIAQNAATPALRRDLSLSAPPA